MTRRPTAFVALLAASAGVLAGPLDRSLLPATAPWVLHVDVEAAVASELGRTLLANRERFDLEGLDALKVFGIDAPRDVLSVTIFAPEPGMDDGVIAITATPAIDALWAHLKTEPHAKPMTVDGVEILSWDDQGERQYGRVVPTADGTRRLALIADEWEILVAAIKAPRGAVPSLVDPSPKSIFFVHADELPEFVTEDADENARIVLSIIRKFRLDIGERDGEMQLRADADFADARAATNAADISKGLLAFVQLAASWNPEARPLADALRAGGPMIKHEPGAASWSFEFSAPAKDFSAALLNMSELSTDEDEEENEDQDEPNAEAAPAPTPKPAG